MTGRGFFPRPSSRAVSVSFSRFSLWKVRVVFLLTTGGAKKVEFCDVLIIVFFDVDAALSPSKKGFSKVKKSELSATTSAPERLSPSEPKHLLLYLFLLIFLLQSTASAACVLFTTGGNLCCDILTMVSLRGVGTLVARRRVLSRESLFLHLEVGVVHRANHLFSKFVRVEGALHCSTN